METKFQHKSQGGWEVAVHPNDLTISSQCELLEKDSTTGAEEVPYLQRPNLQVKTNRLIQYDQFWTVGFSWIVNGPLACLLEGGYWKCEVLFEHMGGGESYYQPEVIVDDLGRSGYQYNSEIEVKPKSLRPGVYRVICCLQYCLKNGSPGPFCGFEDKGLIKIYEDKR